MNISLYFGHKTPANGELVVLPVFQKIEDKVKTPILPGWSEDEKILFDFVKASNNFDGSKGKTVSFTLSDGTQAVAWGLGNKANYDLEALRRTTASLYKVASAKYKTIVIRMDSFKAKGKMEDSVGAFTEALYMTAYKFEKYLSEQSTSILETIILESKEKITVKNKAQSALDRALVISESVNLCRDFVNEPPNILNSVSYAKRILADATKIKGVKVKVLGKAELKKEKAGCFLAVNAGSAHEPQLVHLTYTPTQKSNGRHIALVGKGLTFDTGGYSLKPGGSMINMKFDMAGSSTVYAAFRAAALLGSSTNLTCILGMTDNAVNEHAIMPDSIVTASNGKTVEILNTDAEGRLVLADCLTYACKQDPDTIIDAATLTGACLVAVGHEVCAVLGNDQQVIDDLCNSAERRSEYMWQLPILPEHHQDMKSNIADLKNIAGNRFAGTSKAAAFLENFVTENVSWAHLDIAGIGDSQGHLPYCPAKGSSGSIVRTLIDYIETSK